eukprot:Gb_00548 [translate_table: standard]
MAGRVTTQKRVGRHRLAIIEAFPFLFGGWTTTSVKQCFSGQRRFSANRRPTTLSDLSPTPPVSGWQDVWQLSGTKCKEDSIARHCEVLVRGHFPDFWSQHFLVLVEAHSNFWSQCVSCF